MDFEAMDAARLRSFKLDMTNPQVKADYQDLRTIYAQMGQVGQLPFATLIEFVRRHTGGAEEPAPPVVEQAAEKPKPKPKAKATA